jgi:hypothetical protein
LEHPSEFEPILEADFKLCSYGFRPNRRAQDAIAEIQVELEVGDPIGLLAVYDEGSRFLGWGEPCPPEVTCTLEGEEDVEVVSRFEPIVIDCPGACCCGKEQQEPTEGVRAGLVALDEATGGRPPRRARSPVGRGCSPPR